MQLPRQIRRVVKGIVARRGLGKEGGGRRVEGSKWSGVDFFLDNEPFTLESLRGSAIIGGRALHLSARAASRLPGWGAK